MEKWKRREIIVLFIIVLLFYNPFVRLYSTGSPISDLSPWWVKSKDIVETRVILLTLYVSIVYSIYFWIRASSYALFPPRFLLVESVKILSSWSSLSKYLFHQKLNLEFRTGPKQSTFTFHLVRSTLMVFSVRTYPFISYIKISSLLKLTLPLSLIYVFTTYLLTFSGLLHPSLLQRKV